MMVKHIPLPRRRLGTALSLAALCLAVLAVAPSAALARSNPTTVTTMTPTQFPACQFHLNTYPPGFTAYATIVNTTAGPLTNWSISLTMPSNTSVATIFGGTLTRTATGGTLTPAAYDATIGPGGEAFIGFTGSVSPFIPPSGFSLNGRPCTSS